MTSFLLPMLMIAVAAEPPQAAVSLLDGRELTGAIASWDKDGIELATANGDEKL